MNSDEVRQLLLGGLTTEQQTAVTSEARELLVVAGAGSGKTEVMARRIAWWISVEGVDRDRIVAFTFTEKAAEEMKFRIRKWVGNITPEGDDATLGRMYVGTIHGFCLKMLQELEPATYGMFDVLDDTGRLALIQRWFNSNLGLRDLKTALDVGQFETIKQFLFGYDLLNEFDLFRASAPSVSRPDIGKQEAEWVRAWSLDTDVGSGAMAEAFARSAARYYGTLQARRLLDFSTAQSELTGLLRTSSSCLAQLRSLYTHLVVDEVQDVNAVQNSIIRLMVGEDGRVTAVGDHRQAIYGWRGGRVKLMGDWFDQLRISGDGAAVTLPANFRSTPRVIELANEWARTITPPGGMASPDMVPGNAVRVDQDQSHISFRRFSDRDTEAAWIAATIKQLVDQDGGSGAPHDLRDGDHRGLGLSDIAVLTRTSKDTRLYLDALERNGIAAIVRAGPDLFQQPEVQLVLCALCIAADIDRFYGGIPPTMASIAGDVLNADPQPQPMLRAAAAHLEAAGVPVRPADADRLVAAAIQVRRRLAGESVDTGVVGRLETNELRSWLRRSGELRRIYPQTLFQWLAAEVGVARWDRAGDSRATSAMFHVGQLAGMITGIETPGWVTPSDLKWHMIALTNWGARNARSEEAPLLAPPDAVSILTVHAAKGLEFPVVFLADVAARRFPAQRARVVPSLPFGGPAATKIDPSSLADNNHYDAERRLMYVGLTRSERYLFMSTGSNHRSLFERELRPMVDRVGGEEDPGTAPTVPAHLPTQSNPAFRLVTSFSDLRYYLECPHDYYLRKVLGFAPTIDQAFGYGRGVHNMMRELHLHPRDFAGIADNPAALEAAAQKMIDEGLFYLRYTTGEPLDNMKRRAKEVVAEYVSHYSAELAELEFEPERAFETLIEDADVLVSGAIDVIRHDDPPRVSLIDFKSGDPDKENENASSLDSEQMRLQVSLYGLAAKKELEYEPDLGLVRYLGVRPGASDDDRELQVPLTAAAMDAARETVIEVAESIQNRQWDEGPRRGPKKPGASSRCDECDFLHLCGRPEAGSARGAGNR